MLKQTIFIFIFLIPVQLFGQTSENNPYQDITNQLTDQHIFIPGTKLALIPPEGFEISTSFKGFQKGEDYLIQVFDFGGGNYYSNTKDFSQEAFQEKGLEVFEYFESKINNHPFKYIHLQGDVSAKTHNIIFGDSTFSVMLLGVYTSLDEKGGDVLKKALFSAYYDKNKIIDPLANASFSLDDSANELKFLMENANMFIYTIGGIETNSESDQPILMVIPLPTTTLMTAESLAEKMASSFENKGFEVAEREILSQDKINNYDAFQLLLKGILKGDEVSIFIQSIVKGEQAFVVQGISKTNSIVDIKLFQELSKTFKIKD